MKTTSNIVFDNPNRDNEGLINEFANAIAESMAKLDEKFVFVYEKEIKSIENNRGGQLKKY